ncbi:hypothetical protein M1O52_01790 [Dehalococcoidia bacterium]|nr:hypothetical protein [Dehalococcoidia bacterium]
MGQAKLEKIRRGINVLAEIYEKLGIEAKADTHFLSFFRPIYLLVADSKESLWVMYTNENAVRGSTQWFYLDLSGYNDQDVTFQDIARIAMREIGLSKWSGICFPLMALEEQHDEKMREVLASAARALFAQDLQEHERTMRLVRINPIFSGRNFTMEPNLCFVLMPLSQELQPVFEDHIKPVAESLRLRCLRADSIFDNRAIIEDIWVTINKARVVVADFSGKNPNVFYETGIAHTVGKEVVIITQNIEDVPFDLRHLRHIQYQITPRGMRAFEDQLRNTLITILGRPPTST